MSGVNYPYGYDYVPVAASQAGYVLGGNGGTGAGATGDYIHRVIISVNTAATGTCSLADTDETMPLTAANTPIGVYSVEVNARSDNGPWKLVTGAGVTAIGIGKFSA